MTQTPFSDAEQALLRQAAAQPPDKAARLLRGLVETFWRAGEAGKFAETFRRAYALQPSGDLRRITPDFPDGPPDALRDRALALIRHGVRYAPVVGALAIAEARLGHADAVRRLVDTRRFLHQGVCAPPPGTDMDDFHAALADEIKADLTFYGAPDNRAIRQGWRNNTVLNAATPALRALKQILHAQVARYIAALPDDAAHPFLAARPARMRMVGWAVVSDANSHHLPHLHSAAWLTGVYYVTQPPVSRDSGRGWLRIGAPRNHGVCEGDGWDSVEVEPARGHVVLMPAYFFHETEAMGVDQERICIAFEMQHAELRQARDADAGGE